MKSRFSRGDFLPQFKARSDKNPSYAFDTVAGCRVLLVFVASGRTDLGARLVREIIALAPRLRARDILPFIVTSDAKDEGTPLFQEASRIATVFWDTDRAIHALYGMIVSPEGTETEKQVFRAGAFLMRRNARLQAYVGATPLETLTERLDAACALLPDEAEFAPATSHPPVLLVPEVLDPEICARLIQHYNEIGGSESGFMRESEGITRGFFDSRMKRRLDAHIQDQDLLRHVRASIKRRLAPEIRKAFTVQISHAERYLIGCYDAADQGHFSAHRDNTSLATAHRKFAVTLNLNTGEYDGGELWFPEYGRSLYKPETGGAVVFSCSLLHEARRVTRGRRFALLPFLHDEASSAQRSRNAEFLDRGPPVRIDRPAIATLVQGDTADASTQVPTLFPSPEDAEFKTPRSEMV